MVTLFTLRNRVDTKRIHEGDIVNLRLDTLRLESGVQVIREVVEHNGGVVIAAQPDKNSIILIKQYRYSIDDELIELPAGRLELGEEPLPAAQRELREETGFEATSWTEPSSMYTAPGFCNEILYLYRASELSFVGNELDEDEEIEVFEVSLNEAWALVRSGKIKDAKTIAGISLCREP